MKTVLIATICWFPELNQWHSIEKLEEKSNYSYINYWFSEELNSEIEIIDYIKNTDTKICKRIIKNADN